MKKVLKYEEKCTTGLSPNKKVVILSDNKKQIVDGYNQSP